jgi:TP901 family phage tail tape measure protein
MAAEIDKPQVITEAALKAPLEMADNFDAPIKKVGSLLKVLRELNQEIKSANSIGKLKDETVKLTKSQTELDKVNKQLVSAMQKNNDEYVKQQQALIKLKQEIKDKIALSGREAQEINKLNSSYTILSKALDVNRRKYSELMTEEERASAAGVRLLRVIEQQTKEVDEARASLGQYNQRVGQYEQGILNAYDKINKLNKANKELMVLQKQLTKGTAQETAEYNRLAIAIQQNNQQINNYNQVINNAGNSVKGFVSQLLSAAGLVGAVYLVYNAISKVININKEFEKSLSNLAALTGATAEDLDFYREQAIAIGAETKRSGAAVVEAFKLIGGARPELLASREALAAVTKEAIILANASGLELPEAADALAGALNQMQYPAEKARDVIDALARGAQGGAAEIPQINEALQDFGAVLKDTNGSLEEGVALIEVLADRQIKGAKAGVALRNVLLKLSAAEVLPKSARAQLEKFGVDINVVKNNALPLNERLRELGKIAGDASALVKVFGVENVVAGNIILNNVDKFEKLSGAIAGKEGSLDGALKQADTNMNNLAGDMQEAGAAAEALTTEYGSRLTLALRKIVQGFTFTINLLRALPKFVKENATIIKALAIAVISLNAPMLIQQGLIIKDIALKKVQIIWTKAAEVATKRFYTTLAANPFGLVIAGLAAIVVALNVYERSSAKANAINKATNEVNKDLDETLKNIQLSRKNLNVTVDEYIKKSPQQQAEVQKEADLRKETAIRTLEEVEAKKEKLKQMVKELTLSEKISSQLQEAIGIGSAEETQRDKMNAIEDKFKEQIEAIKKEIDGFDEFIVESTSAVDEELAKQNEKEVAASKKLAAFRIEQAIKAQERIRDEEQNTIDKRVAAEDKAIKLRRKLSELERDIDLENQKLTDSERQLLEEKHQANVLEINRQGMEEKNKLRKEQSEEERRIAEAEIKREQQIAQNVLEFEKSTYAERAQALKDVNASKQALLQLNYEREIEGAKGNANKLIEIQKQYNAESEALARELMLGLSKNFFDAFAKDQGKLSDVQKIAVDNQLLQLNELFTQGSIGYKDYYKKRTKLEKDTNTEILQEQFNFIAAWIEKAKVAGEDVTALEKSLADVRVDIAQDAADKELEIAQKKADLLMELENRAWETVNVVSANITARKQQQLDMELAALQDSYDKQIEMAGNNDKRKEQLRKEFETKEKQIQNEKGRLAQRQARFEKVVNTSRAIINTSRAVTEVLPNIPLAVLIGALGALEVAQIVSAPIPQFYKGGVTKGGLITAGERGSELMILPNKQAYLTPDKTTLFAPPAGTEIIDHDNTMRALAMAAMAPTDFSPIEKNGSAEVVREVRRMRREMRENKPTQVDYLQSGATVYEVKKENDNFISVVRRYSMGNWVK